MCAVHFTEDELKFLKEGTEKCKAWLRENIGWSPLPWPEIPKVEESDSEVLVKAYPILGIEKYMGNYDKKERIAYFPQIKMCHNFTYTLTYLKFDKSLKRDIFIVNGKAVDDVGKLKGMKVMLEKIRGWFGVKTRFLFISKNVSDKGEIIGKGIGTSASAAGAAAFAFISALAPELTKNSRFASVLARYFSGSGTSSICGGWSIWLSYAGINPLESYAVRFDQKKKSKIRVVVVSIPSRIKTENAHEAAEKSEWFKQWALRKPQKCITLMEAVKKDDIAKIGSIAESDSINLFHLLVNGEFFNWEPETLDILRKIVLLRKEQGLTCYATIDTGPTVAIITTKKEAEEVENIMRDFLATNYSKRLKYSIDKAEIANAPKLIDLRELESILDEDTRKVLKKEGLEL